MDDMIESLWIQFAIETREHLEAIEPVLLVAEEGQPPQHQEVAALFRSFHSVKGLARAMDMHGLESLAHSSEDLLGLVREGKFPLEPRLATLLLKALYALQDLRGEAVEHRRDREPPREVLASLRRAFELAQSPAPPSPPPEEAAPAPASDLPPLHDDPEMLVFFIELMRTELPRLADLLTEEFHTDPVLRQSIVDSLEAMAHAAEAMGFHNLLEVLDHVNASLPSSWPIPVENKENLVRQLSLLRDIIQEIERSTRQDSGGNTLSNMLGELLHEEVYYLFGQLFQTIEQLRHEDAELADLSEEVIAKRISDLCSLIHSCLAFYACEAEGYLLLILEDIYHRVSAGQLLVHQELITLTLEAVRLVQGAHCTRRKGATVADAESAESLVKRIRQCLMFGSMAMQDNNLQAMFRDFLDRVAIKPELVEIMTPENMGELMLAIQEGYQPFEIEADLEAHPEIMMAFMAWLPRQVRSITNRTVALDHRNSYEFLVASRLLPSELQKALQELDPAGVCLKSRVCPPKELPAAAEPVGQRARKVLLTLDPSGSLLQPGDPATHPSRPAEGDEKTPGRDQSGQVIRVDGGVLDGFMNQIGEMVMVRGQLQHILQDEQVKHALVAIKAMADQLRRAGHGHNQLAYDLLERLETLEEQQRRLHMTEGHLQGVLAHLQEKVMELRVVPIDTVFRRFPRVVRDLAQKMDKMVRLRITGQDVRIDKGMVDSLVDPLMHMVRNSIDHGLETPEERKKAGKPPQGVLELEATQSGNQVVVEITDDGRGLNIARIRAKALAHHLLTPETAQRLSDEEITQFIFHPGFSTAEQVTETSGRGVGMDVVNNTVNRLGGSIKVNSTPGKGTRVILRLPLSAAIQNTLLVEMARQTVAIPDRYVGEILEVAADDLQVVKGVTAILLRQVFLPVVHLGELLGVPVTLPAASDTLPVVVLTNGKNRLGVAVDRLLRRQELFLKEVHPRMAALPGVGGASILGNGRVVLILEGEELFQLAKRQQGSLLADWALEHHTGQPARVSA